ncbi:metalloregulator ArsR/SmtB family transcription factor [Pelagicoccus sp. SDUM812002]|uniref:ArsR/SmtB family transcription factor n=1 Tax=Pelagicoccus sp. SDUM812002 TaxID=3041266 RepID=UPI00280DE8AB|nr:metalloregulator ArsR/SmtB family transcription factor [Pelagicoccus sp. SDUM812002]MDQ8184674.1 metalloregulator ArsR/SmtB family transcription factor [Pelagicoccus sp. SDUM812002]
MVKGDSLDLIFQAFADATRRAILLEIARGNPTVGQLAKPFDMSGPAISKHLKVLERSGLVTRVKEGKFNRFRLNPGFFEKGIERMQEIAGAWDVREDAIKSEIVAQVVVEDEEMWKY